MDSGTIETNNKIILYKRRWAILFMYFLYSLANIIQVFQYSVIAHKIVAYYSVSYTAVNWSSTIFMVSFIIFAFPSNYILSKLGLRNSMLLGLVGIALGAWIKVIGVHPDRYWVVLLGQGIVSIFKVIASPIPPKLAAVWFGDSEVATACSLALIGNHISGAISYVLPILLTKKGPYDSFEENFMLNVLVTAIIPSAVLVFSYFGLQEVPPTPPSIAQSKILQLNREDYFKSLKKVCSNRSFMIFVLIYGVNLGTFHIQLILGSQIILHFYPNAENDIALIGMSVIFCGVIGAFISGLILDRFKSFRTLALFFYSCYFITTVIYIFVVDMSMVFLYVIISLEGFCLGASVAVGFQIGVELTYPEPEIISGGLLAVSTEMFALISIYIYSIMYYFIEIFWANIFVSIELFLVDMLFFMIKFELKRQEATIINSEAINKV